MPVPLAGLFDYRLGSGMSMPAPGTRVVVPFGKRVLVGLAMGSAEASEVPEARLQAISAVLDAGQPVATAELLQLALWCSAYYKHPLGEVVFGALPAELRRADAHLPTAAPRWELTAAGHARLLEPPGRLKAQFALLQQLAASPATAAALRAGNASAVRLLGTLESAGWATAVPAGPVVEIARSTPVAGPPLNAEQQQALDGVRATGTGFHCHLLDGVTGSGKTEVYLRLIETELTAGRQALVLVPEIGLTPQLLRRIEERLGVAPLCYHSGLAAGERLRAWAGALFGEAPLLVGTRSALFLPLLRPGLIIMDESHDASFKQQDGFRFSGRDVAIKRASGLRVPVLLGTATPSLESLHNCDTGRWQRHRLRQRATGAPAPRWEVLDLRQQPVESGLAQAALTAIRQTLARGEQALVFLNRRGYAPVLLCHQCGWHADCARCDANLTWHRGERRLSCHHCEFTMAVPRFCPECRADALEGAGEGTEQLEQALSRSFPDVPLYRVDRDRVRRKGELERVADAVRGGAPCILVGTQMLAKGHHFPRVTLVVIVNLDQALYSADFRAMERMGQILVQVAGRAGREQHAGTVILQTHHPDHPTLLLLLREGYESLARALLEERQLAQLPPFACQAVLRAEATDRDAPKTFLQSARQLWPGPPGTLYGPFPAMMERRSGRYRWYLLAQDTRRPSLQAWLDTWLACLATQPPPRSLRWAIDVDPQEF